MKLCTLNIWGGKLTDQLLSFVKEYSDQIDIFCFQEVYHSSQNKIIAQEMKSDIFGDISQGLENHHGYFAKHLINKDLEGEVGFLLEGGLAIFIRKDIKVIECNDLFIYREGFELINNDISTIPRNLQYISFSLNNKKFLICHFHGIWYPKTKLDTDDRIKQSQVIKEFLSKRDEAKILCGDFNLLSTTKSIKILGEGMRNLIKEYNILTTRNQYYKREEKQADYVFVTSDININNFKAVDITVSDHLPLLLDFN